MPLPISFIYHPGESIDQISGPGINLKPCWRSFYANKRNAAGLGKVWINATGRARQSNSVVSNWEYQVRYYSGDPSTNYSDRSCTLGVVPNSGTYIGTPVTCNVACDNNLFGKLPAKLFQHAINISVNFLGTWRRPYNNDSGREVIASSPPL